MTKYDNSNTVLENTTWNLSHLPPEGHADVPKFAWELFELAWSERDRQGLPERWRANDKLRRGDTSLDKPGDKKRKGFTPINLFFSNVERTVSNITSRDPVAEVIDLSGESEEEEISSALLLTSWLRKWWKTTKQRMKLKTSGLKMETYGITAEHPYWDYDRKMPNVAVLDCFSFFPAPGYYEDISTDLPYCCNAYAEPIEGIEQKFEVEGVEADDVYNILGEDREENRQMPDGRGVQSVSYTGFDPVAYPTETGMGVRQRRALVVQIWIRDFSQAETTERISAGINEDTGEEIFQEAATKKDKYPGNIRVITITNRGNLLLADTPNPNINPELPPELAKKTHAWDHLPFYKANSYEDTTSLWGFSAAEQTEDLINKISEIASRLVAYALRVMSPPLIVPQGFGITKNMIESRANKPNLILMPSKPMPAGSIYYVQVPNPPAEWFNILDRIVAFFDRIYAIEDADRGQTPRRVVAAAAIQALQERNAALMQSKRESVEYIVEQRGQWAISFKQNFGAKLESVDVQGERKEFIGQNFAGRQFQYTVESGSMMPRSSVWLADTAERIYKLNAIDRQALLETINFPHWKEIIERIGETQLDQALQILVQAGMPEEDAMALKQILLMPQGGPGNKTQNPKGSEGRTTEAREKEAATA